MRTRPMPECLSHSGILYLGIKISLIIRMSAVLCLMEERRRTAAKLLSMGMSQAEVSEITGLDIDEVRLSGQATP